MTSRIIDFSDIHAKRTFMRAVGAMDGKWTMTAERWKPRRSLKANARYWAAIVPAFKEFMRSHGQHYSEEEIHEFFLQEIVGRPVVNPRTGEVMRTIGKRSSKMNTAEFAEYTNRIEEWMVDKFGIVVEEPEMAR